MAIIQPTLFTPEEIPPQEAKPTPFIEQEDEWATVITNPKLCRIEHPGCESCE